MSKDKIQYCAQHGYKIISSNVGKVDGFLEKVAYEHVGFNSVWPEYECQRSLKNFPKDYYLESRENLYPDFM